VARPFSIVGGGLCNGVGTGLVYTGQASLVSLGPPGEKWTGCYCISDCASCSALHHPHPCFVMTYSVYT